MRPWGSPKSPVSDNGERQAHIYWVQGQHGVVRNSPGLTSTGQGQLPGTETHLRHRLLTGQAGYKQPKPYHPKFVADVPQIIVSEPGFTAPTYTATPALSNSPAPPVPTITTAPSTWPSEKGKEKNSSRIIFFFGLQMLVCEAEPAAAPQVRGYLAHNLMLLGLESPAGCPAWVG